MGYGIAIKEAGEIDLYRYGRSKQIFRGPKPSLKKPYVAFIGGSEPFGKFVANPFPRLAQRQVKETCVNWGTPGAGPGFFLKDPVILEACSNSKLCVVQVMDAAPLSNRLYSVYPRRNQRLRGVSEMLKSLYPDVDFSNFKYVPAMLRKMKTTDPVAYRIVLAEQRAAWVARMLELLEDIETKKILLWLAPENANDPDVVVTEDMIETISKHTDRVVKVTIKEKRGRDMLFGGKTKDTSWMTRGVHEMVADAISEQINQELS